MAVLFGRGVTLFAGELNATLDLQEESKLADGSVLLHYIVKKS